MYCQPYNSYNVQSGVTPTLIVAGGGGRAGGMNPSFKVPLTLTSHPFPAVVPFSMP